MALLLLFSAFFSATETAFSSLNKTRVKTFAEKGNKKAEKVLELSEKYEQIAKQKAKGWIERAANPDGSYKLAFDSVGTFSMKYNMVWDKIWGTKLFDDSVYEAEIKSNFEKFNKYGMPLDSRSEYTKSDWLVWTATLAKRQSDFKKFISPLWNFYNESPSRVPMTDWYDTVSGYYIEFIHRTVIGGLFIKLLDETKMLKID
jgi:hypothetical protein